MSTHDELDTLLPDLDGPVSPDPEFAARLRRTFVAASGHQPASLPRPLPAATGERALVAIRPPRRRWLDLAAVVVLLLSMVAGIARVANSGTGGTPTPAIQAPQTEQPVMTNGSAAMDGTWPGPAPASGAYQLRWRGDTPARGYVAPFRDKIYQYIARVGPTNTGGIVAYDAATGAEHWYQPVTSNFAFAVTSVGVVVGIPDSFDAEGSPVADAGLWDFHVELLDLDTGHPIWRSAETYQLASAPFSISAQIVGDTILFVDRQMTLAAIDLASGQERWRVESSELPAGDCDCTATGPAISGDMVYFDNPVTGQIMAVSLRTGEQQWAVDDPAEPVAPSPGGMMAIRRPIALASVGQGVVVKTWWIPGDESHRYFGVLSAADGSPIWEWDSDKAVQDFARFGDSLIVLTRTLSDPEWRLERVDLATGEVLKSSSQTYGDALFLDSLPEADLVLVKGWSTETVGIDPATLEVIWTKPEIEDCAILLPVLPNRSLACRMTNGLAIYEPVSGSATPGDSPAATILAQIENGDFLITLSQGVIMWEGPAPNAEIAVVYAEAGTRLQYMGRSKIDSAGALWYMVRNIETARVGWVPATDVAVAGSQ